MAAMMRLRVASDADVVPTAEPASTDPSNDDDSQAGGAQRPPPAGTGEGEEGEEEEEEPRVGKVEKPMTRGRKHMRGYRYETRPGALQARRRTPKVLVVGGGFAGIAAAARLQNEYGYHVLVLEARDRLGGRCHSLMDDSGVTVELGAAVLMGVQGGNPLAALCRRLGVRMHRLEPKCPIYDAELGGALPPELDARVEALFNEALEAASAAARAPHASSLFVFERAELEIDVAGKWVPATVVSREGGVSGGAERALVRYSLSPQQPSASGSGAAAGVAPAFAASGATSASGAASAVSSASSRARRSFVGGRRACAEEWVTLPSARLRPPALESALAGALRARVDRSWGGAAERALQWHLANLEFACAASLESVSAAEWDQDDAFDYDGDHVLLPDGGYQALLMKMAKGLDVRLNTTVAGIEVRSDGSGIRAVCVESNEVHVADALVLTVPLGVLQTPPEAGGILFTPPLPPRKLDSISRLGFGLLNKVALWFDVPFWAHAIAAASPTAGASAGASSSTTACGGADACGGVGVGGVGMAGVGVGGVGVGGVGVAVGSGAYCVNGYSGGHQPDHETDFFGRTVPASSERGLFFLFLNLHRVSGVPVLLALVAGESAARLERLSDEEVVGEAVSALSGIFPTLTVPAPTKTAVTRWGSDTLARGSYSYVAAGATGLDYRVCAEPVGERLFFAGEHTSEQHPATVVGAHLSGLAAGVAVHRVLRKKMHGAPAGWRRGGQAASVGEQARKRRR